jgi:ferritin
MLSAQMQAALNAQVNAEIYSSYLYLAMSAYCESINYRGAARWLRVQHQEEWGHAMKIFDYLFDRRASAELKAIEQPPTKWDSLLAIFEQTMKHEEEVTRRINELANLAVKEGDHATHNFLEWFVGEQVEEESTVDRILHQLRMINNAPAGLYMIDRELGARAAG